MIVFYQNKLAYPFLLFEFFICYNTCYIRVGNNAGGGFILLMMILFYTWAKNNASERDEQQW